MKAKIYILSSLALGLTLWTLYPKVLYALEASASETGGSRCYSFRMAVSPAASLNAGTRLQRWCYRRLANPTGATFIYNADNPRALPELSVVRAQDGTITHGSLLAGRITFHSLRPSGFNPFPVPLEEPRDQLTAAAPNAAMVASAQSVLSELLKHRREGTTLRLEASEEPTTASATPPWRGYWWPNKGMTIVGPLTKFDEYVTARRGSSPGAVDWENQNHRSHGIWWEGHCNGWAASAVLRSEPRSSFTDSESGEKFSVSDQKGILAEVDFCASATMFGRRFDGRRGDDLADINPALFHKTLLYYIGQLHKPVIVDYHRDEVVDNHVISGYSMNIKETGEGTLSVTTVLRIHQYDGRRIDTPGIAPTYSRTYRYTLKKDSSGNVVSATWQGDNPDFLWVPLGPGRCSSGNPRVDNSWVVRLLGR